MLRTRRLHFIGSEGGEEAPLTGGNNSPRVERCKCGKLFWALLLFIAAATVLITGGVVGNWFTNDDPLPNKTATHSASPTKAPTGSPVTPTFVPTSLTGTPSVTPTGSPVTPTGNPVTPSGTPTGSPVTPTSAPLCVYNLTGVNATNTDFYDCLKTKLQCTTGPDLELAKVRTFMECPSACNNISTIYAARSNSTSNITCEVTMSPTSAPTPPLTAPPLCVYNLTGVNATNTDFYDCFVEKCGAGKTFVHPNTTLELSVEKDAYANCTDFLSCDDLRGNATAGIDSTSNITCQTTSDPQ